MGRGVPPWLQLWELCWRQPEFKAVQGQERPPCWVGDVVARSRLFVWGRRFWLLRCCSGMMARFQPGWLFSADLLLLTPCYPDKDKSSGVSGMFFSDFWVDTMFLLPKPNKLRICKQNCSNRLFLFKDWFLFVCSTIQCFISCKSYFAFRDLGAIDLYSTY